MRFRYAPFPHNNVVTIIVLDLRTPETIRTTRVTTLHWMHWAGRKLLCGGGGGMRQRILGSHTPPCHRRMVITT